MSLSEGTSGAINTIDGGLSDIANGFGKYKCKEATDAMVTVLQQQKKQGKIITIQYPSKPGFILSVSKGDKVISENGFHAGVLYGGLVYCNVHPYGLPKDRKCSIAGTLA